MARLENLQDLWLHNTSITDVGLKEVAKMKQLKSVSMFTAVVRWRTVRNSRNIYQSWYG